MILKLPPKRQLKLPPPRPAEPEVTETQPDVADETADNADNAFTHRVYQVAVEITWIASRLKAAAPQEEVNRLNQYVNELNGMLTARGVPPTQTHLHPPAPVLEVPVEAIIASLRDGTLQLDGLHRKELIGVAWGLGAGEMDTRGKPVKELRELVTGLLQSSAPAPEATEEAEPEPVPPATTRAPFRLPRRLT